MVVFDRVNVRSQFMAADAGRGFNGNDPFSGDAATNKPPLDGLVGNSKPSREGLQAIRAYLFSDVGIHQSNIQRLVEFMQTIFLLKNYLAIPYKLCLYKHKLYCE